MELSNLGKLDFTDIKPNRRVSPVIQRRIHGFCGGLKGKVVVVRTIFGNFVGCLEDFEEGSIDLKVYSGFDRRFHTTCIPLFIVFDLFEFPCFDWEEEKNDD